MKRLLLIIVVLVSAIVEANAVLKEKDLEQTLQILRGELTEYHRELSNQADLRKEQQRDIFNELMETMKRSQQNALMLYSQKQDYVFDLTYACHEATELYQQFRTSQLPFREFLAQADGDIAKYDSLVTSLKAMPLSMLSERARIDRNVCLTLATNIRNTLEQNHAQITDYIRYYEMTEKRLKYLNDYANKRYNDIQTSIFVNGGEDYFTLLRHPKDYLHRTSQTVSEKYKPTPNSQWDSTWIFGLFLMIAIYAIVATLLNMLVIRVLLPKRFHTEEFLKKRNCVIMATTTITFAIILALVKATTTHNFIIMAAGLLVEYAWLLGVILISLLLRVNGQQIRSAFRIYAPLIVVGFLVIAFRIILIPNELVNLIFPPILLACSLWQWSVIRRHNKNVPSSDMFYTFISLAVFIASVGCSWTGYTLLAVQILIWWIMQLTCILTIECVSLYVRRFGERHGYEQKPITKAWFYRLLQRVLLPVMGVLSVMISIYWAADVFNLSDLCWRIFNKQFINLENFKVSIIKLAMVVNMWFIARYVANTLLSLMQLHYERQDPTTAQSRMVMVRNVLQLLVWGIWLLMSLSILNISTTWLIAISGGLSTGIGFASKDIIENIYYGVSLMAGRIKVGDWIDVDGTMGRVDNISYTSTVIESLGGEVITFQNAQLFTKNYKNLTKNHGYVCIGIPYGVAYGTDATRVITLVDEAVNALHLDGVDTEKPIRSIMTGMGDSSIDFKMLVWAEAMKKGGITSEVLKCIYQTLNNAGIEIPFPQRDITIKNIGELR